MDAAFTGEEEVDEFAGGIQFIEDGFGINLPIYSKLTLWDAVKTMTSKYLFISPKK